MDDRRERYASRLLFLAPLIFVAHFLEESPGFVGWFNAHVARGITSALFWRVNLYGLAITLFVVAMERLARSVLSLILAVAWLSGLMWANALFHIAGGLIDQQYIPGLVTALLLYLPYYCCFFTGAIKSRRVPVVALIVAAALGSLPMLAHGYLILFRGSRLF